MCQRTKTTPNRNKQMKYIKISIIASILIALIGFFFLSNGQSLNADQENLKQWKKSATSARQSAHEWQKNAIKIDEQDKEGVTKKITDILQEKSEINRAPKTPNYPTIDSLYAASSRYIDKYKTGVSQEKVREYDVINFALQHHDLRTAESTFPNLIKNREDMKYIAAAELANYKAIHSDCTGAEKYLQLLESLKDDERLYIGHSQKPKAGIYAFPNRMIRLWSQTSLICRNLNDALNIFARHQPMRLMADQYLIETYVDYAIVLKQAGYEDDAEEFIKMANELFNEGEIDNPHRAKTFLAFYTLFFDGVQDAEREYVEYLNQYRAQNPEIRRTDIPFLELIVSEYVYQGEYQKALEAVYPSPVPYNVGLRLILQNAKRNMNDAELLNFLEIFVNALQTKPPFNKSYRFEPLMKAALFLSELGQGEEAQRLVSEAIHALEHGIPKNDPWHKKRSIGVVSKYLAKMGRIDEAIALLDKYPDLKISSTSGTWGVIYGQYIHQEKAGEIEKLTQRIKTTNPLMIGKAIEYLIEVNDWKNAEKLVAKQLSVSHQSEQYKTLAWRKMGVYQPDLFHKGQMQAFQYNQITIINEMQCRKFGRCK